MGVAGGVAKRTPPDMSIEALEGIALTLSLNLTCSARSAKSLNLVVEDFVAGCVHVVDHEVEVVNGR
jgi:hypothetical protein